MPVLLATTHEVLASRQDDLAKFLRGWMVAVDLCHKDLKKAANLVGNFFRGRGYTMKDEIFELSMKRMDITPTYRPELKSYLTQLSQTLVKDKRLAAVPDIDRALNQQLQQKVAKV